MGDKASKTTKAKAPKKGKIDLNDGLTPAEKSLAGAALSQAARETQPKPIPAPGAPPVPSFVTLPDGKQGQVLQLTDDRRDLYDYASKVIFLAVLVE